LKGYNLAKIYGIEIVGVDKKSLLLEKEMVEDIVYHPNFFA